MLGPFQGLEESFISADKAAHGIAFYALSMLAYLAAPRLRRTDLALTLLLFGCLIELAQRATGRDAGVGDVLADGLGIGAFFLPTMLQRWRNAANGVATPSRRRTDWRAEHIELSPSSRAR